MIKAVILDMDGTMFDTERLAIEAWKYAGKKYGYDITKEQVLETIGLNTEKTQKVYQKYFGEEFDFKNVIAERLNYDMEYAKTNGVPIKSGLIELLKFAKDNHIKLAVATSSNENRTQFYLDKCGIREYFDVIVCGDMVKRGKPEPDIFITAAQKLDIEPEGCIVLEDSPYGILASHKAGIRPVMIPDLYSPSKETEALLFDKYESLKEVIRLIEKENGIV